LIVKTVDAGENGDQRELEGVRGRGSLAATQVVLKVGAPVSAAARKNALRAG
jgi:hypothetical protein